MYVVVGIDIVILALAVWFGIYKKRVYTGFILFFTAVIVTVFYGYALPRLLAVGNISTDILNPIRYVKQGEYISFWSVMFSTILSGFWARFLAVSSLIAAFWFGVYRRRIGLGVFLFLTSIGTTYLAGILKFLWR
jgi:hypothetical protein